MKIRITYSRLADMQFLMAIRKLTQTPLETKLSYAIKKIADELHKARPRMKDDFQKEMVEKFAKKDEAGNYIRPEGQPDAYEFHEENAEFKAAEEAFGKKEIELDRDQISLDALASSTGLKLSASELSVLEPIYSEPTEEKKTLTDVSSSRVIPMK